MSIPRASRTLNALRLGRAMCTNCSVTGACVCTLGRPTTLSVSGTLVAELFRRSRLDVEPTAGGRVGLSHLGGAPGARAADLAARGVVEDREVPVVAGSAFELGGHRHRARRCPGNRRHAAPARQVRGGAIRALHGVGDGQRAVHGSQGLEPGLVAVSGRADQRDRGRAGERAGQDNAPGSKAKANTLFPVTQMPRGTCAQCAYVRRARARPTSASVPPRRRAWFVRDRARTSPEPE